jgi:hypothetical protein
MISVIQLFVFLRIKNPHRHFNVSQGISCEKRTKA